MAKMIDLTGKTFNHLTVIKYDHSANKQRLWLCQCDCGNTTLVTTKRLTSGHTTSCGHVKRDRNHTIAPGYEAKRVDGVAVFLLDKKRKRRTDNTTGVTGVKKYKQRDGSIVYQSDITIAGKRHYLGRYPTIAEAATARHNAEQRLIPKKDHKK